MKVAKGSNNFELPSFGEVLSAAVVLGEMQYMMSEVHPEAVPDRLKETLGTPTMFWLKGERLWFSPAARQDCEVLVRFYPPVREL